MNWLKNINVKSCLRIGLMLFALVFVLSACSGEDNQGHETKAVGDNDGSNADSHKSAGCWQKDILTVVYKSIGMTVMDMFKKLTNGALNLMFTAYAVWLAYRLLRFVSSFAEENPGEMWNEIIRKAGICLFCGFLASNSTMTLTVVNDLLFPIYNAFLELGAEIMSAGVEGYAVDSFKALGEDVSASDYPLKCSATNLSAPVNNEFPKSTEEMMNCMICALSQRLVFGMKVSLAAMNTGVTGFVVGFIMLASFVVVYLSFTFYMVDSIFKFGVMILMLPLLILSFAFGPTKEWTKKGFSNIMESAVLMMALCILLTMAIVAMVVMLQDNPKIFSDASGFSDVTIPMMCLLLMAFLVSGSIKVSTQLAGALIGSKVSTKTQEKVKAALQLVGKVLLNLVTYGFGSKVTAVLNKLKTVQNYKKLKSTLRKMAGR